MNILWLSWSFDTVLILLLLSLSVCAVSFITRVIFRIRIPLNLATVLVVAAYTMIAWACFYHFHIPLQRVMPWLAWFLVGGLIGQFIVIIIQKKSGFTPGEWSQWIKGACSFFLFAVFLIILYSWFIADNSFPVALKMNNDIWVYSKYAHIALSQPDGNNIVDWDYFQNDLVEQTPTAFLLIAGLSYILQSPIIKILSLSLILLMAFSAHLIKTICIDYFHQRKEIAWLIGLTWLTSPIIAHLGLSYFLAQWLGITIFLTILATTLKRNQTLFIQLSLLSSLYYLLFMSYPGFYVPYVILLLLAQILDALYWHRNAGKSCWSPQIISVTAAIPISVFIGIGLDPIHFQKMVVAFKRLANEPYFLGEHILINPMSFLSLPPLPSIMFYHLIGLSLLGCALYLSLTNRFSRVKRLLILSIVSYFFFMTYERYFCIFIGLLIVVKSFDLLVSKRKKHSEYFNPHTFDVLLMVPFLLTVIYVLEPSQFVFVFYRLITNSIIMARNYSFDAGNVSANFIGNVFLIVLVGFYIRKLHKNNSLTSAKLLLSILFILNLIFYLCYYGWKGFSYQQWKLGISLVQPLGFIPILAIFYLLKDKKWFSIRMQKGYFICVLILEVFMLNYVMSLWVEDFSKYIPLQTVIDLDNDPTVNRVVVDMEESKDLLPKVVRGLFITVQFVNHKPLEVPILLSKVIDDTKVLIPGTVLITTHCTIEGQKRMLGNKFCMIRRGYDFQ